MSTKFFNFNHEANIIEVTVNDESGAVTVDLGLESVTYESMRELAEKYAIARNVPVNSLKNWTLIEDNDQVSFVLKAATAGLDANELVKLVGSLSASGLSEDQITSVVSDLLNTNTVKEQSALTDILNADSKNEFWLKSALETDDLESAVKNIDIDDYVDPYDYDSEEDALYDALAIIIEDYKGELVDQHKIDATIIYHVLTGTLDELNDAGAEYQRALAAAALASRQTYPLTVVVVQDNNITNTSTNHQAYAIIDKIIKFNNKFYGFIILPTVFYDQLA